MTKSAKSLLKPSLNWFLVFIPVTLFMASGGKTHWYKGVQLLTVYLVFAILFCLIPGGR